MTEPEIAAETRTALLEQRAGERSTLVHLPNGETRRLELGPSSRIAQAVVEVFAPRFLAKPAVLWWTENGSRPILYDDGLGRALRFKLAPNRSIPDLVLVDLGPREAKLVVFVQIAGTDGIRIPRRKEAMEALAKLAGFDRSRVVFLTAYESRESSEFRETAGLLPRDSYAWFVSDPEHIERIGSGELSSQRLAERIALSHPE